MSVFEWISEHEGFFSGLVAITALIGIAGATTRLIWVRARGLGPGVGKRWLGWAIATGGLITIAATTFVVMNSGHATWSRAACAAPATEFASRRS